MESCDKYKDALAAWIVDTGDAAMSPALAAHLERCARCREECRALRHVADSLEQAALDQTPPDIDIVAAVQQRIQKLETQAAESVAEDEGALYIAYIEGDLDPFTQARLERRMEQDPALRAEIQGLAAMHARLQHDAAVALHVLPEVELTDAVMAETAARRAGTRQHAAISPENTGVPTTLPGAAPHPAPPVDLMDVVLESMRADGSMPATNIVTLREKRRTRAAGMSVWQWAGLAAAACLVAGLGLITLWHASQLSNNAADMQMARNGGAADSLAAQRNSAAGDSAERGMEMIAAQPPVFPETGDSAEMPPSEEEQSRRRSKGLSLQDVINARREAMLRDPLGLSNMIQWGALTEDEARGLIEEGGLSNEALAGIAQFLPPEEAAEILRKAIEANPADPYLRAALAQRSAESDQLTAESLAELQAWSKLDPNNSMPHYLEARLQFEMNEYESGLNALMLASSLGASNPYTLQAARNYQEAMTASGMDPEVARLMAALTAGTNESRYTTAMAQQLMEYGQYYESIGDYETAQQIYESLQQMGAQYASGASMAIERQTGLEVQLQAVDAIQQIYAILQDPEAMRVLEAAYATLHDSLTQVFDFIAQFDEMLNMASEDLVNQIAARILRQGNLDITTAQ